MQVRRSNDGFTLASRISGDPVLAGVSILAVQRFGSIADVFRSLNGIYAQVIDDDLGRTLASASTAETDLLGKEKTAANRNTAQIVGKAIAQRLLAKKTDTVVFDRGGFQYHGKVKALADAAREGGLKF